MRSEKDSTVIRQLADLIGGRPNYYLIALIDPELISAQTTINEELQSICAKVKKNAGLSLKESEERLRSIEAWLGNDDRKARELGERLLSAKTLIDSDSYLGYLDGIHKFSSIIADCNKAEKESKIVVQYLVEELNNRLYRFSSYFRERRRIGLAGTLAAIEADIVDLEKDLESSLQYKDAMARHKKVSQSLLAVQELVDRAEKRRAIVSCLNGFSRKAILFFFTTTLAGLILLLASQHDSLAGTGPLSSLLEHRGTVLFASCVLSLAMAGIAEYHSHCRKRVIPIRSNPTQATSLTKA